MTSVVANSLGVENPDPRDVVDYIPTGRWMLFLFVTGMVGVTASVPLNKVTCLSFFVVVEYPSFILAHLYCRNKKYHVVHRVLASDLVLQVHHLTK